MTDIQTDFDSSQLPEKFLTKPNIVEFANSFPQTFAEAAKLLYSNHIYVKDDVLQNRIRLASLGRKFHSEADTLTNTIENQCALLNDRTTKLFVSAHQPNLFAYSGVFKKVVLLETLKTTIEKYKESGIVNLFVIVDHDFINEIWMRRAQLPSFHHSSGLLQLRFSLDHLKKWAIMSKVPRPPEKILYNWRREIISWIKKSSSSPSHRAKMVDNLNSFWEIVESAYSKAGSYSDFNAFLMSKIINSVWGYNTLFVRLSEMSKVFQNGFQFLISNLTTYTDALRGTEQMLLSQGQSTGVSSTSYDKAPMWLHCNCGSKARLSVATQEKFAFKGSCISCKKELTLDLAPDGYNRPDLSKVISFISPRAISLPLLLSLDLQISCYCSGKGALGYLTDANAISKHLGIDWPLILVWDSKDDYIGMAQNQALNAIDMKIPEAKSRLQVQHSRIDECKAKIYKLVNKRTELAKANGSLNGILEDLFQLKEEQRRIRSEVVILEKAVKMLNLRPCILDYAVNFGMVHTEKQWHRHLLEDGNLTASVSFDADYYCDA
ncbi:MAG TPA: hypothetical protein VFH28_02875 [Nitrososphaera sp.]|nr:hypothetical protein [Nitrososphaera sp.]